MSDLEYWTNALRKAKQELDAATTRSAMNAAAGRLMRTKGELRRSTKASYSPGVRCSGAGGFLLSA